MRQLARSRALAAVVAIGLFAVACGGDDEGGEATSEGGATSEATGGDSSEAETGGSEAAGGGVSPEDVDFDQGVTADPCPDAVNEDNGCIYLGTLSDLTEGPFAALAVPITDAQKAFWNRVNENGGIAGAFDVDVETYTRDNKYNPEVQNQVYQEIKPNILAIAQTLGSPTTAAILEDLKSSNIVSAPATWTSLWEFEDIIVESGAPYCIESINAVDYFVQENGGVESVMAVHYPGDYGDDGAAGARFGAEAHGASFTDVVQVPIGTGGTTQQAVSQIVQQNPDLVVLTVAPRETAEIVGGAAAQGYQGRFIGTSPTWNPALLQSPAADALKNLYWQSGPWAPWDTDTPGHNAMREALGDVQGNDGYTSGWAWSYPLEAALTAAAESGDLTREGLANAVTTLESVDYEGMLPEGAGTFTGDPNAQTFRQTVFSAPNDESPSGVDLAQDFFEGETAADFDMSPGPCYQRQG